MTIERNTGYFYIEDDERLLRDRHSKALINTDREALEAYRRQREMRKKNKSIENRVESLENKMDLLLNKLDRLLDD
jgi:hypothetical protein